MLFLSPEYLLKFWNSVMYVVPIVVVQIGIALLTAYGFTRLRGKKREALFFGYVILTLLPYQVTLVPNYIVAKWLGILGTKWAILLPAPDIPDSSSITPKISTNHLALRAIGGKISCITLLGNNMA